ncbi:hypothetical protein ACFSNO_10040 [Streptomyces cirratus]
MVDHLHPEPYAIDLGFVFGNFTADPPTSTAPAPGATASPSGPGHLHHLRKTGTPGRTDWKQHNLGDRPTLVIDKETTAENDPLSNERKVFSALPYGGTKPTLQDLTPLTYHGTPWHDPRVIIALIGPVWTTVIAVSLLAVLAGAFFGIRHLLKRRRTARATTAAA